MAREQYPKLAAERDRGSLGLWIQETPCVWTTTMHALAHELAPGITAEVECPDCEGRGYVDTPGQPRIFIDGREIEQRDGFAVDLRADDRLTDGLSLPRGFFDAPSRRRTTETEAYNRVVENLRSAALGDRAGIFDRIRAAQRSPWQSAMMVTIDDTEQIEVETRAVARHSELAGGRVYTTERRWCTCYDDPTPVLGRRTYSLADLIRAHIKRKPWAAAELAVMGERLMSQGSRWGLWLAHWMAPARPRRRRRPRRWSGRLPERRSKKVGGLHLWRVDTAAPEWREPIDSAPAHYVVTSARVVAGRHETYVFWCDETGRVRDWGELACSFNGALDHWQAITGYVESVGCPGFTRVWRRRGRLARRVIQWPTHPARKELEGELALVASWARAEQRRARRRAALVTDPPWVFPASRRFGGLISPQPERVAYFEGVGAMAGLASAAHGAGRAIVEYGASLERAAESIRHLARVAGLDENATSEVVRLGQEHGDDFARAAINALSRWSSRSIRGVSHDTVIVDDLAFELTRTGVQTYPQDAAVAQWMAERRRPARIFNPSALDSLVGAPVVDGEREVGRVESVTIEGDTRTTGLRATARLSLDPAARDIIFETSVPDVSVAYDPPPEPAPAPERSRQGPPIGDRLARRLRRRRDR